MILLCIILSYPDISTCQGVKKMPYLTAKPREISDFNNISTLWDDCSSLIGAKRMKRVESRVPYWQNQLNVWASYRSAPCEERKSQGINLRITEIWNSIPTLSKSNMLKSYVKMKKLLFSHLLDCYKEAKETSKKLISNPVFVGDTTWQTWGHCQSLWILMNNTEWQMLIQL